ncbi:myo-inositol oxygenase [Calycina marina]|uniref:Inositol oxygenase n=1 Tax=Calycina marina TaxID=1763456 RepID=A0A9P7Z761_9HELO|nr:myo-inositol oxygenase [Calycina marina]
MAPSAISPPYTPLPPNGKSLDTISDSIDALNLLKLQISRNAFHNEPTPSSTPQELSRKTSFSVGSEFTTVSSFDAEKDKSQFRQYDTPETPQSVIDEYTTQHKSQTVAYNLLQRNKFHFNKSARPVMTVWEAMEKLDKLIDPSDPDTNEGQIIHLLQTAEAMRRDGKPQWMQLVGLIHDLGKLLFFYGSAGTWDVVGDTFPVGCAFSDANILPHTFTANPDFNDPIYSTENGIYEPGCGIENIIMSWGHDEYLYLVMKDQSCIPREGLAMIRYHSFYPWHSKGAYRQFMKKGDEVLLEAVQAFNPYDLYSKSDEAPPSADELKPYYMTLINKFCPGPIQW